MALLTSDSAGSASSAPIANSQITPLASAQLAAVAWVRWRFFLNAFRRKGGTSEFIAGIGLKVLYALIGIGPIVGSGAAGYFLIHNGHPERLSILLWAIFVGWIFFTVSTSVAANALDLSLLLRFPMRLQTYLVTRFFFGLLAPANVVGILALIAATIGIGVARPSSFLWSALVLFSYALLIVLLLRVALLWLDRWLAQRRTRDLAAVLFALVFVAFQVVNAEFQTHVRTGHSSAFIQRLAPLKPWFARLHPLIAVMPPSLATTSIASMIAGRPATALFSLAGVLTFTAVVFSLFVWRLQAEFHGESFSEAPARTHTSPSQHATMIHSAAASHVQVRRSSLISGLPSGVVAGIVKEVQLILRGPSVVMMVALPLALVGLYANRLGTSQFVLPLALAYTMLALLPLVYNSFGADAAGIQIYLLSPTPLRQVVLAKNLVHCALITLISAVAAIMVMWSHRPSVEILFGSLFWYFGVLFANLSLGNSRSVFAPVKFDMGKIQRRQSTSQFSVLVSAVVLAVWLGIGYGSLWLEHRLGYSWIAPAVLLLLAIAALVLYVRTLNRIGRVIFQRRDTLIEALCKV